MSRRDAAAPAEPERPDDGPYARAFNPDIERAVLGVVLDGRHPDAWATVRERCAGPAAFWVQRHRLVALLVDRLFAEGKRIDALTVGEAAQQTRWSDACAALKALEADDTAALSGHAGTYDESTLPAVGGTDGLMGLAGAYAPATALAANAAALEGYRRQRQVIRTLIDLSRRAQAADGARHAHTIAGQAIDRLAAAVESGQGADTIGEAALRALAEHDQAALAGELLGGSWGVPALDEGCPLMPGRLILLAARPGCGKTSMMLQAATATRAKLKRGDAVALVELEMAPEDLSRIIVGRQIKVSRKRIERGWLSAQERITFEAAAQAWRANDIPIKGTGGPGTVGDTIAWMRTMKRRSQGRLALVCIDYLGLFRSHNPKLSTSDYLGEITRDLKLFAKDERICVLLLCQLNRASAKERRRPELFDLRDSGRIEQDANAVVFLHSEQEVDESAPAIVVNAYVAKNRDGGLGSYGMEFEKSNGQVFRDLRPPRATPESHGNTRMFGEPRDDEDLFNNPPQQEP